MYHKVSVLYLEDIRKRRVYTPNIRSTFLVLSCVPLYKVHQGVKKFHRDAGPCRLQCFPQLCQGGWMSFGWWCNHDRHRVVWRVKGQDKRFKCL